MKKEYEIVYNSNIIIEEQSDLATLCIFYDKVLMPWENHWNGNDFIGFKKDKISGKLFANPNPQNPHGVPFFKFFRDGKWQNNMDIGVEWYEKNRILFDEKVLDQVSSPPPRYEFNSDFELTNLTTQIFNSSHLFFSDENSDQYNYFVPRGLLEHLLRKDIDKPGIFNINKANSRETYKYYEAKHVFKYLLPQLNAMEPDKILEIRRKVKDTREGFSMHLQKLALTVENAAGQNASFNDISYEAQKIIEGELIPDYREFTRQLTFERIGKGSKALDVAGKFLSIDAAPWTPKFWGGLIDAFGTLFKSTGDLKDGATNRRNAYRFMHICETS